MRFSQLLILRKLVLIILILMTDIIFNSGITFCYLQPEKNSSKDQNFLAEYLSLVLNKSRELEETIYSDILNNLRTLTKIQNSENESTYEYNKNIQTKKVECNIKSKTQNLNHNCSKIDYNKSKNIIETENLERSNKSRTKSLNISYAPVFEGFLYNKQEKNFNELPFRNFIPSASGELLKNSFLLGYSGNPFGSQKLIAGVAGMPEVIQNDRIINDPRKKRSVLHLYNMVLCSTGCNPTAYKGYGCYCGFLGSGFVVDGIDNCCKMHDLCYNNAGCPMFLEYFIPYLWKCYHRQPLCAIDYQYYGSPSSCSQRLCECDRQLALCLRRYPCPTTKALCTSSPWRLLQNILML